MQHQWRTYHHTDWLIREDCRRCDATRKRALVCDESGIYWPQAWNKYDPECVPPAVDMSPAERALEVMGDEKR